MNFKFPFEKIQNLWNLDGFPKFNKYAIILSFQTFKFEKNQNSLKLNFLENMTFWFFLKNIVDFLFTTKKKIETEKSGYNVLKLVCLHQNRNHFYPSRWRSPRKSCGLCVSEGSIWPGQDNQVFAPRNHEYWRSGRIGLCFVLRRNELQQISIRRVYPSASKFASGSARAALVAKKPRKVRALHDFEVAEDKKLTFYTMRWVRGFFLSYRISSIYFRNSFLIDFFDGCSKSLRLGEFSIKFWELLKHERLEKV